MTDEREALPEPVAFRVRYKSEPGMIGNYPWSYLDGKRRKHYDQPKNECEDLFTAAQLQAYGDARAKAAREMAMEELSRFLPGPHYMDPPDGGSVTVPEQLQRMGKDAARYRWLARKVSAYGVIDGWAFGFPTHLTLPAPAVAMHDPEAALGEAIDRAIAAPGERNG